VFASSDNTLTFSGAGQSYAGIVQEVPSAGQIILRIDPARSKIKTITHFVEDLAAGGDIAARAIHAFDQIAWVVAARAVNQTTAAVGINDANTCVIDLTTAAGTVVSKTFNTANPFPGVNASASLGTITGPRVSANSVLSLAVTNGATANPGTFYVQVDYV
jgi:hypothetical protein